MIHTEDQAKTKNCPLARVAVNAEGFGAGNRFEPREGRPARLEPLAHCIASQCMLWVDVAPQIETSIIPPYQRTPGQPPSGDGWSLSAVDNKPAWVRTVAKRGHCGLIKP